MYKNAEILSAVVARWCQPLVKELLSKRVNCLPFLANIESKIKSTGWVSQNWSVIADLQPLVGNVSERLITPLLSKYIAKVPDEDIPLLAHEIVDSAISNDGLSLFEGNLLFSKSDMEELKKYLNCNLPIKPAQTYSVKEI